MSPRFANLYVKRTQAKLARWSAQDPSWRARRIHNIVYQPPWLLSAYLKLCSKRSARTAGIDGCTRDDIEGRIGRESFLEGVRDRLRESYVCDPLRNIEIRKPTGGTRTIAIGTMRDRVAELAFVEIVDPIFDGSMADASFGFRVGRGPSRAVARAVELLADPRVVAVVEADLSGFFPSIRHDLVLSEFGRRITDRSMFDLLVAFLRRAPLGAPAATIGLAQGGSSSPLLANLVADTIDGFLLSHGAVVGFVRYVDDLLIAISDDVAIAERVRDELSDFVAGIGLALSARKTFVRPVHEASQCLGHDLFRTPQGEVVIRPSDVRIQRLREAVRVSLSNQEATEEERIKYASDIVRGWKGYYRPHHLAEQIANAIFGEALQDRVEEGRSTPPSAGHPTLLLQGPRGLYSMSDETGSLSAVPAGGPTAVRQTRMS